MTVKEYNICVDEYSDGVYRFIKKNLKDDDTSKDIVQDTFIKLWEKHDTVSFEKAKSYIFTSVYHTMIDYIRKNLKIQSYDNAELSSYFDTLGEFTSPRENFDLKKIINEAVDRMPEKQKNALLLRDYEGYSYEEIGEITGLNESQVKVYIYRGRLMLKNYVKSLDLVM